VIRDARARFDGSKRNPFDEPECGHHYARSMASWGALVAWTGFDWDARSGTMTFAAAEAPARWFWSNGDAWGTVSQRPGRRGTRVELTVLGGRLRLRKLLLRDFGEAAWPRGKTLAAGRTVRCTMRPA